MVVRYNSDNPFTLDVAVKSAQDSVNYHKNFPCTGTAEVLILNPHSNSNHVGCNVRFELQFPSSEVPDFAKRNTVKFPENFVDNDCLHLQVWKVRMDGRERPWLMSPWLIKSNPFRTGSSDSDSDSDSKL